MNNMGKINEEVNEDETSTYSREMAKSMISGLSKGTNFLIMAIHKCDLVHNS